MDVSKIIELEELTWKYKKKAESIAQLIRIQLQKYCDFELGPCQINPSDGLVICYENEAFCTTLINVHKLIELFLQKKEKLTLADLSRQY